MGLGRAGVRAGRAAGLRATAWRSGPEVVRPGRGAPRARRGTQGGAWQGQGPQALNLPPFSCPCPAHSLLCPCRAVKELPLAQTHECCPPLPGGPACGRWLCVGRGPRCPRGQREIDAGWCTTDSAACLLPLPSLGPHRTAMPRSEQNGQACSRTFYIRRGQSQSRGHPVSVISWGHPAPITITWDQPQARGLRSPFPLCPGTPRTPEAWHCTAEAAGSGVEVTSVAEGGGLGDQRGQ